MFLNVFSPLLSSHGYSVLQGSLKPNALVNLKHCVADLAVGAPFCDGGDDGKVFIYYGTGQNQPISHSPRQVRKAIILIKSFVSWQSCWFFSVNSLQTGIAREHCMDYGFIIDSINLLIVEDIFDRIYLVDKTMTFREQNTCVSLAKFFHWPPNPFTILSECLSIPYTM